MAKHILCADDSVTMQQVVSITFGLTDYTVHAARSCDDALALAKQTPMDLVLADAIMPGKTGYDLCLAIKSEGATKNVPVVIMCGNSQAYDDARGKAVGADAHVTKPWDTQAMLDKVGEILTRTKANGVAAPAGAGASAAAAAPAAAAAAKPAAAAAPVAAAAAASSPGRSATIMGMPAVAMPPAGGGVAPAVPMRPAPAGSPITPISRPQPGAPTPGLAAKPAPAPTPAPAPAPAPAPVAAKPAPAPAPAPAPVAVAAVASAPASLPKPPAGLPRPPLIKAVQPGVTPAAKQATPPVARAVARAAAGPVASAAARALGIDPRGPEIDMLLKMSREVIEQIAWEVVPELAEAIIKQHIDKLVAAKAG